MDDTIRTHRVRVARNIQHGMLELIEDLVEEIGWLDNYEATELVERFRDEVETRFSEFIEKERRRG